MGKIAIQFHALPEELLELTRTFIQEYPLHIVAMKFFPFAATEFDVKRLDEVFASNSSYRQLAFTVKPPILSAMTSMEFADKNPDKLRLDIERVNKDGLRQASLHTHTDDSGALAIWKQVAGRLKKMTRSGVFVRNPETQTEGYYREFRYSAGAKELASRGVPMLPAAGNNLIIFPDTVDQMEP